MGYTTNSILLATVASSALIGSAYGSIAPVMSRRGRFLTHTLAGAPAPAEMPTDVVLAEVDPEEEAVMPLAVSEHPAAAPAPAKEHRCGSVLLHERGPAW